MQYLRPSAVPLNGDFIAKKCKYSESYREKLFELIFVVCLSP